MADRVDVAEARRIAVAAQRFGGAAPKRRSAGDLRALIGSLGAIQIDSVNVLVRSQYLPAFSRWGPYERSWLDRAAYGRPRKIFEYWGHEASFLPIELYPAMRWRMERARVGVGMWKSIARIGRERGDLVQRVLAAFEERGPLSPSDFSGAKSTGSWWGWSDVRRAVQYLFWRGDITPKGRRSSFERIYDLTSRVLSSDVLDVRIDDEQAYLELIGRAARACGVAVESDLRDYFRLPVEASRRAIAELVERGVLIPVTVEGWKSQAYVHREARTPRKIETSAFLSPFDSLVWNRARVHRLFDFHYRIEIYTPAHKRVHGYYVLPYLLDERLVARVDLKADRKNLALLVHAVHYEPKVNRRTVRDRLGDDLAQMAAWLGLQRVRFPR